MKFRRFLNRQIEAFDDMSRKMDNPTNREMLYMLTGMVYSYISFRRNKTNNYIHAFKGSVEIIKKTQ